MDQGVLLFLVQIYNLGAGRDSGQRVEFDVKGHGETKLGHKQLVNMISQKLRV